MRKIVKKRLTGHQKACHFRIHMEEAQRSVFREWPEFVQQQIEYAVSYLDSESIAALDEQFKLSGCRKVQHFLAVSESILSQAMNLAKEKGMPCLPK